MSAPMEGVDVAGATPPQPPTGRHGCKLRIGRSNPAEQQQSRRLASPTDPSVTWPVSLRLPEATLDFRPLCAELIAAGAEGHASMVFVPTSFRLTRAATSEIVAALETRIAEYPGDDDLSNGETWI